MAIKQVKKFAKDTLKGASPGLYRALLQWRSGWEYQRLPCTNGREIKRFKDLLGERLEHRVVSGPFRGMRYAVNAVGSVWVPKILGTYEKELHPLWARLSLERYDRILNVGSAEGYYSVGLAMRLGPERQPRVVAYDTDPRARELAGQLAADNGVTDRIEIRTLCDHGELNSFAGRKILVLCDIEGAELELLDPEKAPALSGFDLLVEVHDGKGPRVIEEALIRRFNSTHDVEIFEYDGRADPYAGDIRFPRDPRWRLHAVQEDRVHGLRWLWLAARLSS